MQQPDNRTEPSTIRKACNVKLSSTETDKRDTSIKRIKTFLNEWPTLLLFLLAYTAWLLLTALHAYAPTVILVPLMWFIVALHSSLQHEVIHGHPTRSTSFNNALAFPAIGLIVPFQRYELLHLQHHRNWLITDPFDDSESYFLAQRQWKRCHAVIQKTLQFNNMLLGRLLIGPAIMIVRMLMSEAPLAKNNSAVALSWLWHIISVAIVFAWLSVFDFPILLYTLAIAYPATSLLMLRAYGEHLPEESIDHRSAIIKSNAVMQLLYLNNNYHRVHHDHPEVPWYRIPHLYQAHYQHHNVHVYPGYFHLAKQFFFKQRFPVEHPFLAKDAN